MRKKWNYCCNVKNNHKTVNSDRNKQSEKNQKKQILTKMKINTQPAIMFTI